MGLRCTVFNPIAPAPNKALQPTVKTLRILPSAELIR